MAGRHHDREPVGPHRLGREPRRHVGSFDETEVGVVVQDRRRHFEEALRAHGVPGRVPPVAELSSTTAIKAAVAAGIGPAVLSSLAVAPELAAGTLRAVKVTDLDLSRRLLAVWAAGRQLIGPPADLRAIAARGR